MLLFVRSGVEQVAQREAARRPRLIGRWTELLLGLKCVGAGVGAVAIVAGSILEGGSRGMTLAVAGLVLVPAALSPDIGPRALGRLRIVALAQMFRAIALLFWVVALVEGREDLAVAALAATVADTIALIVLTGWQVRRIGRFRPRWRRRGTAILARRGLVVSMIRFLRVGLYGADLIVIGLMVDPGAGAYAAVRRVVFAVVAIGLVVPSAFGPMIAGRWAAGVEPARESIRRACDLILGLALPASLGLAITGDRLIPVVFGHDYQPSSLGINLLAARLPLLLVASLENVALVSCRRDGLALRMVGLMALGVLVVLPPVAGRFGLNGVASVLLMIEGLGVVIGWRFLKNLGIAPTCLRDILPILAGCLVMFAVCRFARSWPVGVVVPIGALSYAAAFGAWHHFAHGASRLRTSGGIS